MPSRSKSHIVYKKVGGLEIPLDIHVPADVKNAPILLWFHGGGLLQGGRDKIAPHMLNSVETYKHALISADYRLAPQVGIKDIYEDVRDCIAFIRNPDGLAKQLSNSGEIDAQSIDPSRLAVSGSSAGGYLTFLAGLYVEPKPQVILPIYPITDPLGTFFTTSQPWPTEDGGKVIHGKRVDDATVQPFLDRKADAVANNEPSSDRSKMYNYMLDRANLADLLHFNTQKDPQHDPENDKWRISKQVAARGLPPTYVVHGTVDRDVGIEQADEVVGAMVGEGMEVKYERLAGLDHCFDMVEFDGKDERVKLDKMYKFMHEHV
ncbi:hypothetical protein WHR41_01884 [Cladosporium halotolerans]|uniref:Alpha/beta hydrolase fold-3 domain-containing protein n=1 Tax=Cladosporium halotolerans TaxID=1052096 RepID=A0AB34L0C0_9PEZI